MSEEKSVEVKENGTPHIVIRALWFIFFGWEITAVWLLIAWLLNVSIIGLPIGIKMINYTPAVLTLKGKSITKIFDENGQEIRRQGPEQQNMFIRVIYFLAVGWWISLIWMTIGYLLSVSIIGLPFGIWMLNRLPEVTTLYNQN